MKVKVIQMIRMKIYVQIQEIHKWTRITDLREQPELSHEFIPKEFLFFTFSEHHGRIHLLRWEHGRGKYNSAVPQQLLVHGSLLFLITEFSKSLGESRDCWFNSIL